MSIRNKVLLSFFLIAMVFFLMPLFFGLNLLGHLTAQDKVNYAEQKIRVYADLISDPFLPEREDIIWSLEESLKSYPEIKFLRIESANGNEAFRYGKISDEMAENIHGAAYKLGGVEIIYLSMGRVSALVDVSEVDDFSAKILDDLVLLFVLGLFMVLAASIVFSRWLMSGLNNIVEGAGKLADGDFSHRIPLRGKDEIAQTAEVFNDMSARLERLYQQVDIDRQWQKAIVDNVIDGIITIGADGVIRTVNQGACSMFGYAEHELVNQNVSILTPSPHRENHDNYISHYLQTGQKKIIGFRRHLEGVHKSGRTFAIELAVTHLVMAHEDLFIGAIRDMTEINQLNQELELTKQLNDEILNSALDGIVTLDQQGLVISANPAALMLFEYTTEELVGGRFADFIRYEDERNQQRMMQQVEGSAQNTLDFTLISKNGTEKPVEMLMTPITVDGKEFINIFIRDIRARQYAEKMMLKAKENAESASKAKSDFLAVMSHEIRTPLNAILGSMSIISDLGVSAEQKRYLDIAKEGGKSLLWLINDILDFSKIEAGKLELESIPFDPIGTVEDALDLMQFNAHQKGLELTRCFASSTPVEMVGDQAKLTQVVINLISNAIKFTETGGIMVDVSASDQWFLISVQDTGVGISETNLKKLFAEFEQVDSSVKRRQGGTGLGLAISRKLARLMGGDLKVTSQSGEGSCFTLNLPLQPGSSRLSAVYPQVEADVRLSYRNALFLDAFSRQLGLFAVSLQIVEDDADWIEVTVSNKTKRYEIVSKLSPKADRHNVLVRPLKLQRLYDLLTFSQSRAKAKLEERRVIDRSLLEGKRILLAEDSHANQIIALAILNKAGYKVDVAANGREAVEAVKNFNYDLILMDVSMPEMDGIEATQHIRNDNHSAEKLPILALTANVFKDDVDRCLEAGMQGFIPKPIDKVKLLETIANFLIGQLTEKQTLQQQTLSDGCLDEAILQSLISDVGMDMAPEMIEIFLNESFDRLGKFKQALMDRDFSVLRAESHAMKSASGAVGLTGMQNLACEVEAACREERHQAAIEKGALLPSKAEACLRELQKTTEKLFAEH